MGHIEEPLVMHTLFSFFVSTAARVDKKMRGLGIRHHKYRVRSEITEYSLCCAHGHNPTRGSGDGMNH